MDLYQVFARGVREVMGPHGGPVEGGRYEVPLDTAGGTVVLTMDSYGLRQLHAMLDPWARALESQEAGRVKQRQGQGQPL